ncbi:mucin-like protein [Trema orientale]|uniref:Mucin-like protein n=1 Tax=Trema orientale TaxID=63057 RepID=A0A2P5D1D8_TREOI|nr:mucin-like protein [Trema orientale]
MNTLQRIVKQSQLHRFPCSIAKPSFREFSSKGGNKDEDDWNDAWETAWLPEELSAKSPRAPWEGDVNFSAPSSDSAVALPPDADSETKAFVEEMNDNWSQRRGASKTQKPEKQQQGENEEGGGSLYSLENMKKDYRLKKQRIHAGLWMKEIEKQEEAKLGDSTIGGGGDDIERLLDSCSDIFDSGNEDLDNAKISSSVEFKAKPDGWETTSKIQDGNIWEMTQREEDILLQEFERRIAYSKFQIASFIKTHIFTRRRPIDGWKYMIEELGPNARKGKGSVSRLPTISDASTQPFKEENMPIGSSSLTSFRKR